MPDVLLAQDRLPAFPLRPWTKTKLRLIEGYLAVFAVGMRKRWRLVYIDLFAGPGLCVDGETGAERPGSALLAAARKEFDAIFLSDIDGQAVGALERRIGGAGRVTFERMDCNAAAAAARRQLFPAQEHRRTLGLAVIDPMAFQISFDAIERMTAGLRVDLIITFMTGYAHRFIGSPAMGPTLDRFFGTAEWRSLVPGIQRRRPSCRELLDLYEERLRSIGYSVFDDHRQARNRKGSVIYHMIYASKHELGGEFWRRINDRGQLRMELA